MVAVVAAVGVLVGCLTVAFVRHSHHRAVASGATLHDEAALRILAEQHPPKITNQRLLPAASGPLSERRVRARSLYEALTGEATDASTREMVRSELAALLRADDALAEQYFDELTAAFDLSHGHALVRPLALASSAAITKAAVEVAHGDDETAALAGLRVLDQIDSDDPTVRASLLALMGEDAPRDVLLGAMYGLENIDPKAPDAAAIVDAALQLGAHSDVEVRRRALITASRWTNDAGDVPALAQGLRDEEMLVRAATAYAFGETVASIDAAVPDLISVVRDVNENSMVRAHACRALGEGCSWLSF